MGFKDHFSGHAESYSHYRPGYPVSLYQHLVAQCAATNFAWDCATGNGQVAGDLAQWFDAVIATDASEEQINHAQLREGISYRVAPAENSGIKPESIDLLTVGQALHWFDIKKFLVEAERVLKPGGVFAAWTYHLNEITPAIDKVTYFLYQDLLGDYWSPERVYVESAYKNIELPFKELSFPDCSMQAKWSLTDFLGYLNTWSAVKRFASDRGFNPVVELRPRFVKVWGEPDRIRHVHWPLHGRIGLKSK